MNVLGIGNSFSQDATRYLRPIAESAGCDMYIRNCYIGGCSLERHVMNSRSGEAAYDYELDAVGQRKISLDEALSERKWDIVTVQQVSGLSGIVGSYEPYLGELIAYIKQKAPGAEIVFHRTWAYEKGSKHQDFVRYGCDQEEMFRAIVAASTQMAEKYGLRIIKSGDAIQAARKNIKAFDLENGGMSLNRDGFHLSLDYGRYLAGLVWFRFLTGSDLSGVGYAPENTDPEIIERLKVLAAGISG